MALGYPVTAAGEYGTMSLMGSDRLIRAQGWVAAAALAALPAGLLWAPELTSSVLAAGGFAMLATAGLLTARDIGLKSTALRAALGASAGAWAAVVDRGLPLASIVEIALVFALAAICTAKMTGSIAELRRVGPAVFFGLREAPPSVD